MIEDWEKELFEEHVKKANNGDLESSLIVSANLLFLYYEKLIESGFAPYEALELVIEYQSTVMEGNDE